MKAVQSFLILLATLACSAIASAATIPSFQIGGSVSDNTISAVTGSSAPSPYPNDWVQINFAPQTLTVTRLFDGGNSGLAINDNLAFAGGSVISPLFSGTYVPFVNSNLVTFTTTEGSFAFDSENLGLFDASDVSQYIPNYPISNGPIVAFSTGTLRGPGGSSPADFMFFVNYSVFIGAPFGDVAWALYAPTVLPTLPSAVPEPTSMAIFGLGAVGLAYRNRRKRKA